MPRRERDDQFAMTRSPDPLAITIRPPFGERAKAVDGALDLAGVAHVDRADLHPERRLPRLG